MTRSFADQFVFASDFAFANNVVSAAVSSVAMDVLNEPADTVNVDYQAARQKLAFSFLIGGPGGFGNLGTNPYGIGAQFLWVISNMSPDIDETSSDADLRAAVVAAYNYVAGIPLSQVPT